MKKEDIFIKAFGRAIDSLPEDHAMTFVTTVFATLLQSYRDQLGHKKSDVLIKHLSTRIDEWKKDDKKKH